MKHVTTQAPRKVGWKGTAEKTSLHKAVEKSA